MQDKAIPTLSGRHQELNDSYCVKRDEMEEQRLRKTGTVDERRESTRRHNDIWKEERAHRVVTSSVECYMLFPEREKKKKKTGKIPSLFTRWMTKLHGRRFGGHLTAVLSN